MQLSAPLYRLKREARLLSREAGIPLAAALDRIAAREGHAHWSLLAQRAAERSPAALIHPRLRPGEMILVAARPGQGKTLLALELAVEAMKAGNRAAVFTLEYVEREVEARLERLGVRGQFKDLLALDCSDEICSARITGRLQGCAPGTLAVIDYLQILDQRRDTPDLQTQVAELAAFARRSGAVLVFVSQVDRTFDPALKPLPDLADLRLPNPLDLSLFDRAVFLQVGRLRVVQCGGEEK
ncbi:DNA helicase [Stappia indica]|uniref:DNA helicase n=1 Tax=Stappia indica TaxID=538381 RepID=UPI000830E88E|nr:DNA helicase [Stappia indica]